MRHRGNAKGGRRDLTVGPDREAPLQRRRRRYQSPPGHAAFRAVIYPPRLRNQLGPRLAHQAESRSVKEAGSRPKVWTFSMDSLL